LRHTKYENHPVRCSTPSRNCAPNGPKGSPHRGDARPTDGIQRFLLATAHPGRIEQIKNISGHSRSAHWLGPTPPDAATNPVQPFQPHRAMPHARPRRATPAHDAHHRQRSRPKAQRQSPTRNVCEPCANARSGDPRPATPRPAASYSAPPLAVAARQTDKPHAPSWSKAAPGTAPG